MNDRATYYCLKRNAERGLASLGQLQRLDELAAKFEHGIDEFDNVGTKFRTKKSPAEIEREQAAALAAFDRVGMSRR